MDDLVIGDWNKLTLKKTGEGVVLELHGVHKQDKTLKPYEVMKLREWLNKLHLEQWMEIEEAGAEVNDYAVGGIKEKRVKPLPSSERMPFDIVDCM